MATTTLLLLPSPAPPPEFGGSDLRSSLSSCSSMAHLHQLHSQLIRLGLSSDNDAAGRLIRFAALSPAGDRHYAVSLFLSLPNPDPFIFNTLFRSPSLPLSPLHLYSLMLLRRLPPNNFTFPCLLSRVDASGDGRQVHAHAVKFGFWDDGYVQNNLIHMYFGFGVDGDARKVFDGMRERDVVTWTTMVSGYARMGKIEQARVMFDEMPHRSSVLWNAMIAGYVQAQRFKDAFVLFDRMREEGVEVDKFVAASMLSACTALGALDQGEWIHKHIEKNGIELD